MNTMKSLSHAAQVRRVFRALIDELVTTVDSDTARAFATNYCVSTRIGRMCWLDGTDPPGYVGPAYIPKDPARQRARAEPYELFGWLVRGLVRHDGTYVVVPIPLNLNRRGASTFTVG